MTAVEFLQQAISNHLTFEDQQKYEGLFQQALETERLQIGYNKEEIAKAAEISGIRATEFIQNLETARQFMQSTDDYKNITVDYVEYECFEYSYSNYQFIAFRLKNKKPQAGRMWIEFKDIATDHLVIFDFDAIVEVFKDDIFAIDDVRIQVGVEVTKHYRAFVSELFATNWISID